MSNLWIKKKVHCIGKYNVYSIRGHADDPHKWYTEVYAYTRHGNLLYRDSFGSNAPTRLLAVWSSLIRYWLGK